MPTMTNFNQATQTARRSALRALFAAGALASSLGTQAVQAAPAPSAGPALAAIAVKAAGARENGAYDGSVEAVRQAAIAAQVAGAIVALNVKAGDSVKAGQVLLRIDARAAQQASAASQAQVTAARSSLEVAAKDFERQKLLYQQKYISQAALERAEAQFRATSAQLTAGIAQSSAAAIESNYYVVTAPYAGIVSEVPVMLGDMAMPGRPLLTLYDPGALRVTATVPQSVLARLPAGQPVKVELPGLPQGQQWQTRPSAQVLPAVDAATHTAQVRIDLPANLAGVAPGMFARAWLPLSTETGPAENRGRVSIPASAVLRRAEMRVVYVLDANGRPLLRQIRLGQAQGSDVEVLAGLAAGERIAADPAAAARMAR